MPLFFNSANDAVGVYDPVSLQNIWSAGGTVCGWCQIFNRGGGGFGRIAAKGSAAGGYVDTNGWSITTPDPGGAGGRVGMGRGFSVSRGEWWSAAGSFPNAEWHHIAVTYDDASDANDPIFYIDGVSSAVTENIAPSGAASSDAGQEFCLGSQSTTAKFRTLGGWLDDVRVYRRILSANEIACIAAARGVDGVIDQMVARWMMDDAKPDQSGQDQAGYIGVGSSPASTTITVEVPGQRQDGDTLIMIVASGGDASGAAEVMTTPAGWTQMNVGQTDTPATVSTASVWVYRRTASSEPANYTLTGDQTSTKAGIIIMFKDVPAAPDVSSTLNTGNDAVPVAPSVTPSGNAMLLRICCADDDDIVADSSAAFPTTVNARSSFPLTGTGNGVTLLVSTELVSAGATGTANFALLAAEEWGCLSYAFLAGQGARNDYLVDISNRFPSRLRASPGFTTNGVIRSRRKVA